MGLFDKIKDNAKTISMKAIEATREYDEDYPQTSEVVTPAASTDTAGAATIEQPKIEAPLTEPTVSLMEEEITFLDEQPVEPTPKAETAEPQSEPEPETKPAPRKSKVTEVSKTEHEQLEKEKRQEKAKQAAKERLAKSYVPSYKNTSPKEATEEKVEVKKSEKSVAVPKSSALPKRTKSQDIVDITPGVFIDPTKKAIYARERAALNALASQRKLNGSVPLYTASHMNFKTRVFINRIEYSGSFGKNVIPIEQVTWVKLRHEGTGVIIETTEGKRVVMVVKPSDRLAFADAILKVQALQPKKGKFKDTKTVRIDELEKFGDGVDEIEKLAKLFDKGILSQEEFDTKKKQILGI